jgi:hypothetical protein
MAHPKYRVAPPMFCQLANCEQNNRSGWTVDDKLTDNYVGNAIVFLEVCVSISGIYQFEIYYNFVGQQCSSGAKKFMKFDLPEFSAKIVTVCRRGILKIGLTFWSNLLSTAKKMQSAESPIVLAERNNAYRFGDKK